MAQANQSTSFVAVDVAAAAVAFVAVQNYKSLAPFLYIFWAAAESFHFHKLKKCANMSAKQLVLSPSDVFWGGFFFSIFFCLSCGWVDQYRYVIFNLYQVFLINRSPPSLPPGGTPQTASTSRTSTSASIRTGATTAQAGSSTRLTRRRPREA